MKLSLFILLFCASTIIVAPIKAGPSHSLPSYQPARIELPKTPNAPNSPFAFFPKQKSMWTIACQSYLHTKKREKYCEQYWKQTDQIEKEKRNERKLAKQIKEKNRELKLLQERERAQELCPSDTDSESEFQNLGRLSRKQVWQKKKK